MEPKIYVISRKSVDWDQFASHCIRAQSEQEVRELAAEASEYSCDEDPNDWLDPEKSEVRVVPMVSAADIILSNFKNG